MHFHLPKPLHGWREFFGEVGIIVIGVLIALGAEQVVERLSWRKHVAEAREDLRTELEGDLFNAKERVRMESCIHRRLDQLDDMIENPPLHRWRMLPGHSLIPIRVWSSSGWDSAIASNAVSHMSSDERAQYAGLYSFVRGLHALVLDEFAIRTEMRMLERGGPFGEASRDRLHADVARLQGYNALLALGGRQLSEGIERLGIPLASEHRKELDAETCPMPADSIGEPQPAAARS